MAINTTFTMLAPNPGQQIDSRGSPTVYVADAYGIITGVPIAAVRDLVAAGCINLGPTSRTGDGAGWNGNAAAETVIAAFGATQGNATLLSAPHCRVTVTASTEGVILKSVGTSASTLVRVPGAVGVKVYPPTSGIIDAGSANAAVVLAAGKAAIYTQRSDLTHFDSFKSA